MKNTYMAILALFICASFKFKHQQATNKEDYNEYYRYLNHTDSLFFIKNEKKKALEDFYQFANQYSFVWVFDAIKYAEMALVEGEPDIAKEYIKLAIRNGFELDKAQYLKSNCNCCVESTFKKNAEVYIFEDYINENKEELEEYYQEHRKSYLNTLDTTVIKQITYNHVYDQFTKEGNQPTMKNGKAWEMGYQQVQKLNATYLDNFFTKGIFIGERNTGIYTDQLFQDLGIANYQTSRLQQNLLKKYHLENDEKQHNIPVITDSDYFGATPMEITYYHSREYFVSLPKQSKTVIKEGYMHPREYIYIFKTNGQLDVDIGLKPSTNYNKVNKEIARKIRSEYNLPSLELDSIKHVYAHEHQIKLFFGFMSATR